MPLFESGGGCVDSSRGVCPDGRRASPRDGSTIVSEHCARKHLEVRWTIGSRRSELDGGAG